ncbi:MAG: hypothetical protein A3F48_01940 [Candidatus Yanofskybacteria bacterium RIFCSPHIGHO2_12_FULL_41_9]|nr:MAG: hypothetical protein A3F48_01940 [Candidatus Yanofskybacteria bacterium RIFCSPHIGHO2_12_FULL_41_9]
MRTSSIWPFKKLPPPFGSEPIATLLEVFAIEVVSDPSVIQKNLISEVFNNRYKQDLQAWIKDFNLEPVRDLLLE